MTLGEVAAVVGIASAVTVPTVSAVSIVAYRIFMPRQDCAAIHQRLTELTAGEKSDIGHLVEAFQELSIEVKELTAGLAEMTGDMKVLAADRANGRAMEKLADAIMAAIGKR